MTRVFSAALLAVCGLTSVAPAQTFYSGTTGYTSYYAPAYTSYYAPAYTSYYAPATTSYYAPAASYSTYSYQSNFGPLGVLGPRFWFGGARRSAAYASPFYGTTPSYTAAYSPVMTASPIATASYYAPADTTLAMASPVALASNSCCTPCTSCPTCPSNGCPGGNCSLNYAPTSGELKPEVDPNSSGSSGTRTFGSESGGAGTGGTGSGGATQPDNFRPYERERDEDGFGSGERGAGYRPESKIEKKAPAADLPDDAEPEAEKPADGDEPAAEAPRSAPAGLSAPASDEQPEARAPALPNLDAKITAAPPSLLRERSKMKARFGSPKLARAKVDPSTLPAAAEVRLVRK